MSSARELEGAGQQLGEEAAIATLVVDASVVVAALIDGGPVGGWADALVESHRLVAPSLMPFEVVNILRRVELRGDISSDVATLAHQDLLAMAVTTFAHDVVADRIWELRHTVTAYDAGYVALAEGLDVGLATLDRRLAVAPGPVCAFVLPDL